MIPYPLLFDPIYKEKVWGGRSLEKWGKTLPPQVIIGESWEIADLPPKVEGGRSVIANGPLQCQTLHEVLQLHGAQVLGYGGDRKDFPLLIKYLDARENLSVQVHPPTEYVERHPGTHLKSEAWVVVEAEPGAVIYKGIKGGVTREQFAQRIATGEVADELVAVPATVGDCYYLPSGTCHALGAGIMVAEIQTPSDTTFRVYDWGRTDRELHIEQALECISFEDSPAEEMEIAFPIEADNLRTCRLVKTEFFEINRMEVLADTEFEVVTGGGPWIWMMQGGGGQIHTRSGPEVELRKGVTVLLPAALDDSRATVSAGTSWLSVSPPSPYRNVIA